MKVILKVLEKSSFRIVLLVFIFNLYMDSNSTLRIPDIFQEFCFFLSNIYKQDLNCTSEEPNQEKIQFTDSIVVQPS